MKLSGFRGPKAFALVVVLAVLLVAVGCGSSEEEAAPTAPPVAKVTAVPTAAPTTAPTVAVSGDEPRRGGTLVRRMGGFPSVWDVLQGGGSGASEEMSPIYSQLLQWSPEDGVTIVPDLALSWDTSNGGKTFTFTLRPDAKFNDGTPVTANDVLFSYDRMLNPLEGMAVPRAGALPELIDSMEVVDDHTIKFNLTYSAAIFAPEVASGFHSIQPRHVLEGRLFGGPEDLVGSGPWMMTDHDPDVFREFEKNPFYYLTDKPYLDRIRHVVISDPAAAVSSFKVGQVHMTNQTFPETSRSEAEKIEEELGAQMFLADALPAAWIVPYYINLRREPWSDLKVRRAIHLAIDRSKYTNLVEEGLGGPQGFFHEGPNWLGALTEEEIMQRPGYRQPKDQDIAEAKRLLQEAGVQPGTKANILSSTGVVYKNQCILLAEDLEEIGFEPIIEAIQGAQSTSRRVQGEFDFACQATGALYLDTDSFISLLYLEGGGRNHGPWTPTSGFMELYLQERAMLDVTARAKVLRQMEEILWEELPLLPGSKHMTWMMWRGNVKNYHFVPVPFYNNTKLEDVWLSEE
jgi:peptide/nickel transport system substrate-binding protein